MRKTGSNITHNNNSNEIRGGEKKVMKKSLSVILSTTMALSAFSSVALAASSTDFSDLKDLSKEDKAIFDKLINDGIFLGVGEGKFGKDEPMKRSQFAVAISKALKYTADATTSSFSDVAKDAPELPYIEAAYKNGVVNGNTDGTFDPAKNVTREQLAILLVGAMGPQVKAEAKALQDQVNASTEPGDTTVTKWAQAYVTTAVKYKLMAGTEAGFNGKQEATRYELAKGIDATLKAIASKDAATKVESVSASNLKEILVTFDGQVKKEEAEEITNYKLNNNALTGVSKAKLQEDGKSVLISLNEAGQTLTNQKTYSMTVSGISGVSTAKVDFAPLDVTVPEVTNVEVLGNKVINVTFSEPVTKSSATNRVNYKVNGFVGNGEIELSKDGRTATITLYSRLAAGDNKITISGVKDYANMTIVNVLDRVVNVVEDKAAPASFEIVKATLDAVTVKFDEPVDKSSIKPANIYWSDNAGTVKHVAETALPTDTTFTTYEFTFAEGKKLPARDTVLYVEKAMDLHGNTAAKLSANVNASVDVTRPEVLSLGASTNEHGKYTTDSTSNLDLKFNKSISTDQFSAAKGNANNLVVKNSKGEVVSVASSATKKTYATNTLKVKLSTQLKEGETYTVEIKNVTDGTALNNKIIPQTFTLTMPHVLAPVVSNVDVKADAEGNKKILVVFNKPMDLSGEYSILNSERYMIQIGNTWYQLPEGSTFQPTYDNRGVVITIPYDEKYDGTNAIKGTNITGFKVSLVADAAGNKLVTKEVVTTSPEWGIADTTFTSVKATAKDKVEVKFDRPLQAVYADDFVVTSGGSQQVPTSATYETVDGKGVVTLTLGTNLTADVAATITTTSSANISTLDLLGNKIKEVTTATTIVDGVAPSLISTNPISATNGNTIVIAMDENLVAPLATTSNETVAAMFTVKVGLDQLTTLVPTTDYSAAVVDNKITITLKNPLKANANQRITVATNNDAMYIFDAKSYSQVTGNGNKVKFETTDVYNSTLIDVATASANAAVKAVNDAATAAATQTALESSSLGLTLTTYNTLSATQKTAAATAVFTAKPATTGYADKAAIQAALDVAVAAQLQVVGEQAAVNAVNGALTVNSMQVALESPALGLTLTNYNTLGAVSKELVAQAVLGAKPATTGYADKAAIQAALDAAVAPELDKAAVATAKANLSLTVNNPTGALSTIILPTSLNGATIAWAVTGTGGALDASNTVFTTAARESADLTATLTATITKGAAPAATQTFTVTVKATETPQAETVVTKN